MNRLNRFVQVVSVLVMIFFSVPKLTAQPPSVKGFSQFSNVLNIDPYLLMYTTGIAEALIAILLFIGMVVEWKNVKGYLQYSSLIAFFMLLCTIISALLIEFFVRPAPEIMLTSIAIILAAFSMFGLYNNRNLLSKMVENIRVI